MSIARDSVSVTAVGIRPPVNVRRVTVS